MFGINSSGKKIKWLTAVFKGWLTATVLLSAFYTAQSRTMPDLTKPFKKCAVFNAEKVIAQNNASDNDFNFILQTKNNNFISINPDTKLENWIVQNGGTVEADPFTDENSLFFINSVNGENSKTNFLLNSLSLKTGVTNWQQKLGFDSQLNLLKIPHKNLIFLLADKYTLIAVHKSNGVIKWSRNYAEKIRLVNDSQNERIGILTENSVLQISTQNGEIQQRFALKNTGVTDFQTFDNHILLGLSTGEVIRFIKESKAKKDWKIKTGGSISNLIVIQDSLLTTSLDNFLYLFSMEGGKQRWKRRVGGRINIQPLITGNFAIVVNENNNIALVINLEDGRVANQIEIEEDNGFSGQPVTLGNYLVFQTYKGVFFFTNGSENC